MWCQQLPKITQLNKNLLIHFQLPWPICKLLTSNMQNLVHYIHNQLTLFHTHMLSLEFLERSNFSWYRWIKAPNNMLYNMCLMRNFNKLSRLMKLMEECKNLLVGYMSMQEAYKNKLLLEEYMLKRVEYKLMLVECMNMLLLVACINFEEQHKLLEGCIYLVLA